jgi:hypothetical protein
VDQAARNDLSLEGRCDLPYNAAYALAPGVPPTRGHRPDARYPFLQRFRHAVDLPPEQSRVLGQALRKHRLADHEGQMEIDQQLVVVLPRVTAKAPDRVTALLLASG